MNKIAIYLRLSKEDELIREESNSISTQRDMIHSFIRKHNDLSMMEVLEFKDDGYSGKNMERPGMQEMMELVKKRQIGVVIVKDFSRFSRDYLVIGQYTEQIFPFMGIRFIAINENYDSNKTNGGIAEIDAAFKGLLYDFYSEDLSVKVKSSIQAKKETGKFLNVYAPYGYQKTTDGAQSLVIEPEGAATIRKIFQLYADGTTMYGIACKLNREKILCPQEYIVQRDQRNYFRDDGLDHVWTNTAVRRILHNEVYRGCVVYHKAASLEVGAKHSTPLCEEEWKVNENMHEAIIDEELWKAVQERLPKDKRKPKIHQSPKLIGKVICAGCGKVMQSNWTGRPKYVCRHRNFSSDENCVRSIRHEDIDAVVLERIRGILENRVSYAEAVQKKRDQHQLRVDEASKKYQNMQTSKNKIETDMFNAYESFKSGLTQKETYLQQKSLV